MPQGLLLLSAQGMCIYSWHRRQLSFAAEFQETAAGLAGFRSYLTEHRAVPFRLLVDLPDESFRLETIPPARGADRRAIIGRRLAQATGATPYTCVVSLGKQDGGRKNEVLILAALTRPAHLSPWLDLCCDAGALIQQIVTPPFLLSHLTKTLRLQHGRHLLFTLGAGGLRQTCFEEGQLQFSRLVARPQSPGDTAKTYLEEARKVRHYLNGGGLLKSSAEATFHALLAPQEIPAFDAHCMAEGEALMHGVDLSQVETHHGISNGHASDSHCDALLLHLMAKGVSTAQFAAEQVLRPYRLWQWRRRLAIAGITLFGSCFTAAAAYAVHAQGFATEALIQERQNQASRQRYQALLQTLPPMPARPAEMHGLNAGIRALQMESSFPEATYPLLSRALDEVPAVELDRIEWRLLTTTDPNRLRQERPGDHTLPHPYQALATLDLRVTATGEASAISVVETLAAALRRYPDTEVDVMPTPVADTVNQTTTTEERFSLRLVHSSR